MAGARCGDSLVLMALYELKPWYGGRLSGVRRRLVAHDVDPTTVTWTGVGAAALAGVALATLPTGWAALAVVPLLAARMACANLDGALAREAGRTTRWGAVANELGDRAADLLVLAGCLALAPAPVVLLAMLAACLPSFVSLTGAAAGLPRLQAGPVGKVERVVVVAVIAAVGSATPLLLALAAGSLLTAVRRIALLRAQA